MLFPVLHSGKRTGRRRDSAMTDRQKENEKENTDREVTGEERPNMM